MASQVPEIHPSLVGSKIGVKVIHKLSTYLTEPEQTISFNFRLRKPLPILGLADKIVKKWCKMVK
jgi:hypothetical protein